MEEAHSPLTIFNFQDCQRGKWENLMRAGGNLSLSPADKYPFVTLHCVACIFSPVQLYEKQSSRGL